MPKKQRCHLKNIVRICEKLLTLALLLDASMTAESDWQLRRTAGQQIFHLPLRGKPMLDIGLWHKSANLIRSPRRREKAGQPV
jgi:hypothetical protein